MHVLSRFLTLLMMVALVAAQGPAFAAAICRHHDAVQHTLALQSHDRRIAAAAASEETAAAAIEKKGQLSHAGPGGWISDMLTPAGIPLPPPAIAAVHAPPAHSPLPDGRSPAPPPEPPSA